MPKRPRADRPAGPSRVYQGGVSMWETARNHAIGAARDGRSRRPAVCGNRVCWRRALSRPTPIFLFAVRKRRSSDLLSAPDLAGSGKSEDKQARCNQASEERMRFAASAGSAPGPLKAARAKEALKQRCTFDKQRSTD